MIFLAQHQQTSATVLQSLSNLSGKHSVINMASRWHFLNMPPAMFRTPSIPNNIVDLEETMGEPAEQARGLPLWSPNKEKPPCWVRVPAGDKACTLFRIHQIRRPSPVLMVVKMDLSQAQGSWRSVACYDKYSSFTTIFPYASITRNREKINKSGMHMPGCSFI